MVENSSSAMTTFKGFYKLTIFIGIGSFKSHISRITADSFEARKYDFTVPRPIQKLIDAEAKKRAALEKRKKK